MIKTLSALCSLILFCATASAVPLRFEEGKHYEVIGKVASEKPRLTEYFSFYCPHCFRFEQVAQALEQSLPQDAKFVKNHVDFMRAASKEVQNALARAMVAAEKVGMKQQVVNAIFKQIHVDRRPFNTENDVVNLFSQLGGDSKKLIELMNSFAVKGSVNKMKQQQQDLSTRKVLTGVPMFIVNDKYKILPKELKSLDDYKDLVAMLLSMK